MTEERAMLEADCAPDVASLFTDLATEYLAATRDRDRPVSAIQDQRMLAARFEEPMPRTGSTVEDLVERIRREVIDDSNWLYHPRAMGHQVAPPLPAAIWAESLISAMNQSTAVFEMSPVGTTIERRVIRWMCDLVGFGPSSSGTMTTGGTEATFTALLAARARLRPDAWEWGVGSNPPVLVCGEHAHYAATRPAGELGLGVRNVVTVPSKNFRLDPTALSATLRSLADTGRDVLAVVATAGSTATGSFDDLTAIADACEQFDAWLHVDAAHGGSALLSSAHRHRVRGIDRARSIAWDPHKTMLIPLQAGMLLVRDAADLDRAYSQKAPYLFHSREEPDQGTRSFLCSRRAEAIKVWIALQRYGADMMGAVYDGLCETAAVMEQAVAAHPRFRTVHQPESNILCFRWVGDGSADDPALDHINLEGREHYNASGHGWVTTTVLEGRRVLRVTIMNPRTEPDDVRAVLDALDKVCASVAAGRAT